MANDGTFFYSFAVPAGLATGTDLCDRGFVSGDAPGGGFGRETSNDVCLETEVRPEQILLASPPADVSQMVERDRPGNQTMPLLILDELPRTGSGRLLVLFAGLALAGGGAAVTFSTPRRRRNLQ